MKHFLFLIIVALFSLSCHSQNHVERSYKQFGKEIHSNVFSVFDQLLPSDLRLSMLSRIRYPAGFNYIGCAGISVVFQLEGDAYLIEKSKLQSAGLVDFELFKPSIRIDSSHDEFLMIKFNQRSIALPRLKEDYCLEPSECMEWNDLLMILLETNKKEVFRLDKIDSEFAPEAGAYDYSIGAMLSDEKKQIIYWLYIYN